MTFLLYGIIPIPAWLFVSGVFAWDSYHTLKDSVSSYINVVSDDIYISVLERYDRLCRTRWGRLIWCGVLSRPSHPYLLNKVGTASYTTQMLTAHNNT